jgi:hypothetical protein
MLALYLIMATLGTLSLPAVGAYQTAKVRKDSKRSSLTWWNVEWLSGDYAYDVWDMSDIPMPVAYFIGIWLWPLVITGYLAYRGIKFSRIHKLPGLFMRMLAAPGKAIANHKLKIEPKKDQFLLAAEKEVEEILLVDAGGYTQTSDGLVKE